MSSLVTQLFGPSVRLPQERRDLIEQALRESPRLNGTVPSPRVVPTVQPELLTQPLSETRFVVLDVETSGPHPERDRLTEVGAVEVVYSDGRWVLGKSFESLVRPGVPIPFAIQEITGITDELVRTAPLPEEILPSFFQFLDGAVLIGQSVAFDRKFVAANYYRLYGESPRYVYACTCQLSRRLFKIKKYNLDALAAHFDLMFAEGTRHRAMGDARVTAEVFIHIINALQTSFVGIETVSDLLEVQMKTLHPDIYGRFEFLLDKVPAISGVYMIRDADGRIVYVRRARELKNAVKNLFHRRKKDALIFRLMRQCASIEWRSMESLAEAESIEQTLIDQHLPYFNYR